MPVRGGYLQRFAEGLREAGYEILSNVAINQVLVSFGSSEVTRFVIEGLTTRRQALKRSSGRAGLRGDAHQHLPWATMPMSKPV